MTKKLPNNRKKLMTDRKITMPDKETIAIYDEQVEKYANLVTTDKPGSILQGFIDALEQNAFVLDLGCGPANSSALMRTHGLKVDPVDASQEMVNHANTLYDINARAATFDDLDDVAKYDGIWANFSLLHAPIEDFPRYLLAIHTALVPKGIFHIGMKLGNGMKRDSLGRLYSYYSKEELTQYLQDAGFTILEKTFGEEPGLSGEIAPWITILCKKSL